MRPYKLLVVDDDPLILDSIGLCLPPSWNLQGWKGFEPDARLDFDAAFVDMHLDSSGEPGGLEVISKLRRAQPHLEIVAISGDLDRSIMEQCLVNGASRFLAKPLSPEEIQLTLDKIEAHILLKDANKRQKFNDLKWVGDSPSSEEIRKTIASMRGEAGPILIAGESGTGKEVAAKLLNAQEDADRPFVAFNVAAIPENLFESEFFGHAKGAFSGAEQNKMGLAEAAHRGDLFLDEIEALPLNLQVKLLRFLETHEIRRVGSNSSIEVDVRVIAATNRDLGEMVSKGEFREDLFWRLSGQKITLPPLRDRRDDVEALTKHFLDSQRPRRHKTLAEDGLTEMIGYAWPGNVRELKRVCEQLSLVSPLPIIRGTDVSRVVHKQESENLSEGLATLVARYEKTVIESCLKNTADINKVSEILKISRSSLYKKIKDHQIQTKADA